MGFSLAWDAINQRDVGYGVPAECDHPDCDEKIDRGLSFVCGDEPAGRSDKGCGLHFCYGHLSRSLDANHDEVNPWLCDRCTEDEPPFPPKPDIPEWVYFKLTDDSWAEWRESRHPAEIDGLWKIAKLPDKRWD